jgi:hypothetical protein
MMDMRPRYAPTEIMTLTGIRPLVRWIAHPPGTHPDSPIVNTMTALEGVTSQGSRWFGCAHAYITSERRMVVIGTNDKDEVRMRWPLVSGESEPITGPTGGGTR